MLLRFRCLSLVNLLFVAGYFNLPQTSWGQLDDEAELAADGLVRGWVAELSDGSRTVSRVDRQTAFVWKDGVIDERLSAGAFEVSWKGLLESESSGEYRFAIKCDGGCQLSINGERLVDQERGTGQLSVSDPIELDFDLHSLELGFRGDSNSTHLVLYWTGPGFGWERLPVRRVYHDATETVDNDWESDAQLFDQLRCAACHDFPGVTSSAPLGPDLGNVAQDVRPTWLIRQLTEGSEQRLAAHRGAMPFFSLSRDEANAVVDYLVYLTQEETAEQETKDLYASSEAEKIAIQNGQMLFNTVGCLACHTHESAGESIRFGRDLSQLENKRTRRFVRDWLDNPSAIQPNALMPAMPLSDTERLAISAYLVSDDEPTSPPRSLQPARVELGRELVRELRCASCHENLRELDPELNVLAAIDVSSFSRREVATSCLAESVDDARQPQYHLQPDQVDGLLRHLQEPVEVSTTNIDWQLERHRCYQCHSRDLDAGIGASVLELVDRFPHLSASASAMQPPSLSGVGDKLTNESLHRAIRDGGLKRRPWLAVRMPNYELDDVLIDRIADYWKLLDQLPPELEVAVKQIDIERALVSGPRLVGANGFGCISCHQIGNVESPHAAINAKGPSLSQIGEHVRPAWFRRWVANPVRIQTGIEMPAIQVPVQGLLDDDIDNQLAAVWQVLNLADFQPPRPSPIRVVRSSGITDSADPIHVLTDVTRLDNQVVIKPFVLGLPNRHNLLFDAEIGGIRRWWLGDTLQQHAEGKSWYWEPAGTQLWQLPRQESEWKLVQESVSLQPTKVGQFATEVESWSRQGNSISWTYLLRFAANEASEVRPLRFHETVTPLRATSEGRTGYRREVHVTGLRPGENLTWSGGGGSFRYAADDRRHMIRSEPLPIEVLAIEPSSAVFDASGELPIVVPDGASEISMVISFVTTLPADQLPLIQREAVPQQRLELDVAPGFTSHLLPIDATWMPTALCWDEHRVLYVASLKGRVWRTDDRDGDGFEDWAMPFSDDLAAPFGLHAVPGAIDVINKYGLLRLHDEDRDGRVERTDLLASGWGHTDDYHDWAVGLPSDSKGNYYVALSCQQDDRPLSATKWRGTVLRLVPPEPIEARSSEVVSNRYTVAPHSGGHRFPIGMAMRYDDELFVTDNQGNFNPFNELNHARPGLRYGFVNAFEKANAAKLENEPPAINIPHPWTRSVNGICFLQLEDQAETDAAFGPYAGHLVGCEYDTRRLVRMSLETVEGTVQGAVYPLTYDRPINGEPLLGPITCAVSPLGDLYIGNIRDSGWGGSNNIGNLVKMRLEPAQLPPGISEIRALTNGFVIQFARPVDPELASDPANYRIASSRRVPTPAYGGDDVDQRLESIDAVDVSADRTSVRIQLNQIRERFVYHFSLKPLVQNAEFFPFEAFYTLHRLPRD